MSVTNLPEKLTAVLFSGGDAPGMNALLRALVRLGKNRHKRALLGVRDGYKGLLRAARKAAQIGIDRMREDIAASPGPLGFWNKDLDLILMDNSAVSGIVVQGGILLRSARCVEFRDHQSARQEVIDFLKALNIDSLIVCGGDGSLAGAECLVREGGIKIAGVPATIDNDLSITEMALGVQSAVATIVWAVDHFKDTARSHRRVMVLETMGRHSGELTQLAAIASGAEFAIIPENGALTHEKMRELAVEIDYAMQRGRTHTIVLIAEGVEFDPPTEENPAEVLANVLEEYFGKPGQADIDVEVEVRPSQLGHLQRGGRPDPADAILAAQCAEEAWKVIMDENAPSGVTAMRHGRVTLVPFGAPDAGRDPEIIKQNARLHRDLSGW